MLMLVGTRMAMLTTHTYITTSGGKYSNPLVILLLHVVHNTATSCGSVVTTLPQEEQATTLVELTTCPTGPEKDGN
jgi:hypothetical protein